MTYIYLVEIGNNQVYVGKTKNPTYRKSDHRKTYGGHITYTIIDQINSLDKKDWTPLEKFWIEQFRQWGFKIVNPNPNGGGGSSEWSEKSKKQQSEKFKNRKATWAKGLTKGFQYTEEQKQKMRKPRVNKWVRPPVIENTIVNEIRNLYATSLYTKTELHIKFNLSQSTIRKIVDRIGNYK